MTKVLTLRLDPELLGKAEARAARLGLDLIATTDLLLDFGVKGNLDAHDVLHAIERFNL